MHVFAERLLAEQLVEFDPERGARHFRLVRQRRVAVYPIFPEENLS